MTPPAYHLAQFNIARMKASIDHPIMAEFVANLDPINRAAENAPGFIWRLQTDEGNATSIRIDDDDFIIVNMSVWESVEAVVEFTYRSEHVTYFRRRREWFEKMDAPILVAWWIPVGHVPTPHEGRARLEYLRAHGPTPYAFTFKQRFTPDQLLSFQPASDVPPVA